MSITQVDVDGVMRYKVSGELNNIKVTYDGEKYIMSPYSFNVTVQYTKIGTVTYSGSDAKFTYTLDYIDLIGIDKTAIIEQNLNDGVSVTWVIVFI